MIQTFKHRGLKRLYEHGDRSRLDVAVTPVDLDLPGYRLHALKGDLKGFWSVRVSGNWRIIFCLKDGDAFDVNLIDYH